jgi:glycosyltransferase involved in cell wall biosynthesis
MTSRDRSPLVSIVVASYNHAAFLRERMKSLIQQTYQPIEILVIDDCSSDNSVDVLREYCGHPQVKLTCLPKNGGWVRTSNMGLRMAKGEFILFANCDDSCAPEMVEKLLAALHSSSGCGFCFCRSLLIDEHGQVVGEDFSVRSRRFRVRCAKDTRLSGDELAGFLLHSCVVPNLSAVLFRREVLLNLDGFTDDYRVCCDWDLFFRVAKKAGACYVAEPLNYFRQHSSSIRNSAQDTILVKEYCQLLLSKLKDPSFTLAQKLLVRWRTMYLMAVNLSENSEHGFSRVVSNLAYAGGLDKCAVSLFPVALPVRLGVCALKRLRCGSRRAIGINRHHGR